MTGREHQTREDAQGRAGEVYRPRGLGRCDVMMLVMVVLTIVMWLDAFDAS
nr:hypothetical protein [Enhygromyxa salina]